VYVDVEAVVAARRCAGDESRRFAVAPVRAAEFGFTENASAERTAEPVSDEWIDFSRLRTPGFRGFRSAAKRARSRHQWGASRRALRRRVRSSRGAGGARGGGRATMLGAPPGIGCERRDCAREEHGDERGARGAGDPSGTSAFMHARAWWRTPSAGVRRR